jgi:beta-lactamase class A
MQAELQDAAEPPKRVNFDRTMKRQVYTSTSVAVLLVFVAFAAACGERTVELDRQEEAAPPLIVEPTPDAQLSEEIARIADDAKGKVGVSAIRVETGETVGLNESDQFAMQSVVKVPISLAVLRKVALGEVSLDEKVAFTSEDLVPAGMRSPLRDKNPKGGEATIEELIRLAVAESDGTASDILQRVAGGAREVQAFIDSLGIAEMQFKHSHKEFFKERRLQFDNWSSPEGAVALMTAVHEAANEDIEGIDPKEFRKRPITKEHANLMLRIMTESNNPPNRIKGLLPPGTSVAHKTGTSGTWDGVTPSTNDIGIITLPNGNHIIIAVFVGNSTADEKTREGVIARLTLAIWEKWGKT